MIVQFTTIFPRSNALQLCTAQTVSKWAILKVLTARVLFGCNGTFIFCIVGGHACRRLVPITNFREDVFKLSYLRALFQKILYTFYQFCNRRAVVWTGWSRLALIVLSRAEIRLSRNEVIVQFTTIFTSIFLPRWNSAPFSVSFLWHLNQFCFSQFHSDSPRITIESDSVTPGRKKYWWR